MVPTTSVFWYIIRQQDLDWCTSCPGKDSSPNQVGRGQPRRRLFPWVSLILNGILTSVYHEVPKIVSDAFAEFIDFHCKPASL